jgi:hypothetical protein
MTTTKAPTRWTRRLQLLTLVLGGDHGGTAVVLGYITVFLVLNAIGIAAVWDRAWVFWVILATDVYQGVGFTVDWSATGLRDIRTYVTDVGGGVLRFILLGFAIRYRSAWAYQRA